MSNINAIVVSAGVAHRNIYIYMKKTWMNNFQVWEKRTETSSSTKSKIYPKWTTQIPIIIEFIKDTDKQISLKYPYKKKYTMYTNEQSKRMTSGFSSENTQFKEQWQNIFNLLKEKKELLTKVSNIQLIQALKRKPT